MMVVTFSQSSAQKLLIPMDLSQTDHLKAYGIAYWGLTKNIEIDWLLNYRAAPLSWTMPTISPPNVG